ncbi:MAG: hypothetical protein ACPG80_00865 [Rickettsiales bacterium]
MSKTLPAILIIVSLLLMNVASAFHAHAAEMAGDSVQIVKSLDTHSDNDAPSYDCDQCNCHSHCGHLFVGNSHDALFDLRVASKRLIRRGETYLSQLHYPPSRPPRA